MKMIKQTHKRNIQQPQRRAVLRYGLGILAGVTMADYVLAADSNQEQTVSIEIFGADGNTKGTMTMAKVVKTEAEWQKQLAPLAFQVTRHEDTEVAFSGEYNDNHEDGIYRCICCDTALYDSKTKFESGTGWPSFWLPISALNITRIADNSFGMRRTAIACRLCDAHLGHVFDDGPKPTGLRYCMNSVALNFVVRA
jgi:peptide-methionine (R)-S-oxide reductase